VTDTGVVDADVDGHKEGGLDFPPLVFVACVIYTMFREAGDYPRKIKRLLANNRDLAKHCLQEGGDFQSDVGGVKN
jgi:hypothetical protein